MRVGIVDTKFGSLYSIYKTIETLNDSVGLISDPKSLSNYDKLILPGTGNSSSIMKYLKDKGFYEEIIRFKNSGNHILGICVGMQILFNTSGEGNKSNCFNFFDSNIISLHKSTNIKTNIGWFRNSFEQSEHKLKKTLRPDPYFFFCHSYFADIEDKEKKYMVSNINNEINIASVVEKENLLGVQFHPEKSQLNGQKLIEYFLNL